MTQTEQKLQEIEAKKADVIGCLTENQLNEIILHLDEYGTMTDKYCFGLPTGDEDMKQMRELIIRVLKHNQ
jgi:hypothetical protein